MIGKEIRIDNIINSKLLGTNHLVQGFIIKNNKQYLYTDLQESYLDLEDWQGIELKEEYILKLGFEWYKPLSHYRKVIDDVWYQIRYDKDFNRFYFSFCNLNFDERVSMPPIKIRSVHHLQNLFFELSNIELL